MKGEDRQLPDNFGNIKEVLRKVGLEMNRLHKSSRARAYEYLREQLAEHMDELVMSGVLPLDKLINQMQTLDDYNKGKEKANESPLDALSNWLTGGTGDTGQAASVKDKKKRVTQNTEIDNAPEGLPQ